MQSAVAAIEALIILFLMIALGWVLSLSCSGCLAVSLALDAVADIDFHLTLSYTQIRFK